MSPAKLPRLETESLDRRTVTHVAPRLRCTVTRANPLTAPVTLPDTRARPSETVVRVARGPAAPAMWAVARRPGLPGLGGAAAAGSGVGVATGATGVGVGVAVGSLRST